MAVMTAVAVTGAVVGAGMGIASAVKAGKDQREAERLLEEQNAVTKALEESRQDVINPMAGLTNEAEKVGVATQAAEFQAEEADQALANTLDTIMQTGGGAGGATALAQMALKSKQGISADIQKQERQNAVNVANSQQVINQQIAEGEKFKWQYQEDRERQALNRSQNLADKYEAQAYAAEAQKWEAYGTIANSVVTGMGNVAGSLQTQALQGQYDQLLASMGDGTGIANQTVGTGSMSQTGTGGPD